MLTSLPGALNAPSAPASTPIPGASSASGVPQPGADHAADANHFARELSKHQAEPTKTEVRTSTHEAAQSKPEQAPPSNTAANTSNAKAPERARERDTSSTNQARAKEGERSEATDDSAKADGQDGAEEGKDKDACADLSAWFAALTGQGTPPQAVSKGGKLLKTGADARGDASTKSGAKAALAIDANANANVDATADANAQVAAGATAAADAKDTRGMLAQSRGDSDANFQALIADVGGEKPARAEKSDVAQRSNALDAINALGASTASASASSARAATAEAVTPAAHIAAHVSSDDFAPALATQVSLFAANGVQEAHLHLNPAEMGPIAVRISVDDAQARVDFTAEQAGTRSAIEASLPDLAASLREAGLTLTGGGVFQQSAQQQQQQQHSRGNSASGNARNVTGVTNGARSGSETVAAAPSVRRTVRAGGVDTYA